VTVLSGFKTLLWTSNARVALEDEHNNLVAAQIAAELVEEVTRFRGCEYSS